MPTFSFLWPEDNSYCLHTHCTVFLHLLNLFFSDEIRSLRTEKDDFHKETERWKAEQLKERDEERQQHKCVQLVLDICSVHIFPVS